MNDHQNESGDHFATDSRANLFYFLQQVSSLSKSCLSKSYGNKSAFDSGSLKEPNECSQSQDSIGL